VTREEQIKNAAVDIADMFHDKKVPFDIGLLALAFAYAAAADDLKMSRHTAIEIVLANLKMIEK
jgi:hypothetical protein